MATSSSANGNRASSSSPPPPWTQIVRGESEPIVAAPSSPSGTTTHVMSSSSTPAIDPAVASVTGEESMWEGSESGPNGNAGKRQAWNKPSNGPVAEVGPVMGAVSWPALSESTRASAKPSSEPSKGLSDIGSPVAVLQGTGTTSSSLQKQVSNNVNPNPTSNHSIHTRQRSMRRNNASTSSNGGLPQQQLAPPGAAVEMGPNNPSSKDHTQRSGFASQSHGGNDHPPHRNSFRNRNGGSHPRGDGSHHHGYGGSRGNQDWNTHRNFSGRDNHMQPQRGAPRFIRPPPPPPLSSTPFIPPPPVRPFASPIGFPELPPPMVYVAAPPPDSLRSMPFPPMLPHPFYYPPADPHLPAKIVKQIDYYFSGENLIKDTYLRQNMDDQGWVPITLIARFKKVMLLSDNVQFILDSVRASNILEVQGDKIRRRNDWMRWIISPAVHFPNASGQQTFGKPSYDMLEARVQSMALEEKSTNHHTTGGQADPHGAAPENELPSEDLSSSSQLSGGRKTDQVGIRASSDHSISARN
ncbi:la-related protein 1C-like [Carya illinoinensis]|uniref:HTH La-type RNA-binding domain-containing protein n=1 Tax=Carya illinoinensis TaxID=32201 RepID=A0A8T1PVS4_CARIL|nr:la-related protein 1C-like [Carya illinoinensis]KAG6645510.1 hypothetical protein CIPAW_08G127500 [Carya illinoinensis]KAG6645511.1 hypothetical protein CIPAW_08G127500 [Carya illinoinensis]KAG6645512.1 hypothetical protein CIPAW_08G127500 [Carya illinoinensis]KAG6645513.1 hypothetical protein CIPAW_08G127500 [Carya illinoinensis]KAG6645514.1 hypothetical protein CIPAW_08G127500 [Carya illinoinensis]